MKLLTKLFTKKRASAILENMLILGMGLLFIAGLIFVGLMAIDYVASYLKEVMG